VKDRKRFAVLGSGAPEWIASCDVSADDAEPIADDFERWWVRLQARGADDQRGQRIVADEVAQVVELLFTKQRLDVHSMSSSGQSLCAAAKRRRT
jgi:hypothetical protein